MRRLYIVDDEDDILFSLGIWFKKTGYEVTTFHNSKDLLTLLQKEVPDVILLDVNLQGEDGRDICKQIKSSYCTNCPVVLFSANPTVKDEFRQCKADDFVGKPFSLQHLSQVIASHATG